MIPAPGAPEALAFAAAGLTVGALFRQQAAAAPDRPAIAQDGVWMSYGELDARVNRLAHGLAARGLTRAGVLAIVSENRREHLEVQLAAAKLGLVVACPNWRQSVEELRHCLGTSGATLVFASERFAEKAAQAAGTVPILFGGAYEALLRTGADSAPPLLAAPEDPLLILFTSGTTGFPKGAAISHRAMVARTWMALLDETLFPTRTFVCWAPLFHMAGADNALGMLMLGGRVRMMEGFDAEALAEILGQEEIGLLSLGPGTVEPLIAALRGRPAKVRGVALVGAMADLVPPASIAEITGRLGAPFRNTFGSTETGPAPASRGRIPVGVAPARFSKTQSSFCLLRLVDPDGVDVPDGAPGEVLVRAPSLFSGYWRLPDQTAEDFRDGWFHMGDVMVRNPDRTLDFVDRRKYLIKSGGENIYPAEIERLLMARPEIAEAVVVRQRDTRWGEVPVAFVVARDSGLTEDGVIAMLRGRIAPFKVPKRIHFLEETDLPRSVTGKVRRQDLEARLGAPRQDPSRDPQIQENTTGRTG
ncbi:class I adenylate-forming enzyme family protein [Aquabacter spiritensis]|uniref:Fatty-acyl-CoA synthase n=1 Tax=Aquabacter spiritensis TaxID=933073 RepID=A0A4R3M252_9HYPH|nr:AMP-binding protein [Aquabacter spiritensis]TCT05195.1 fatty-acyl-CoA synthase [Aquabacter spiritensis]